MSHAPDHTILVKKSQKSLFEGGSSGESYAMINSTAPLPRNLPAAASRRASTAQSKINPAKLRRRWSLMNGLTYDTNIADFKYGSTLAVDPGAEDAAQDFNEDRFDDAPESAEDAYLRSAGSQEDSQVVKDLKNILWRRTMVLEEIRRAYLRDVVSLKHVMDRVLTDEERNKVLSQYIQQLPTADLTQILRLHAPQGGEFRINPCRDCGGTIDIIVDDKEELVVLREKHSEAIREQNVLRLEIAKKDYEVEKLTAAQQTFREEYEEEKKYLFKELRSLREEKENLSSNIAKLQLDNGKIRRHEIELRTEIASLQTTLASKVTVEEDNVALRKDQAELLAMTEGLRGVILSIEVARKTEQDAAEEARKTLTSQLAAAVSEAKAAVDEASELRDRLVRVKEGHVKIEESLQKSNQHVLELQMKIAAMKEENENQISRLISESENLDHMCIVLREEVKEKVAALDRERVVSRNLRSENTDTQLDNDRLSAALKESRSEISSLKAFLVSSMSQGGSAISVQMDSSEKLLNAYVPSYIPESVQVLLSPKTSKAKRFVSTTALSSNNSVESLASPSESIASHTNDEASQSQTSSKKASRVSEGVASRPSKHQTKSSSTVKRSIAKRPVPSEPNSTKHGMISPSLQSDNSDDFTIETEATDAHEDSSSLTPKPRRERTAPVKVSTNRAPRAKVNKDKAEPVDKSGSDRRPERALKARHTEPVSEGTALPDDASKNNDSVRQKKLVNRRVKPVSSASESSGLDVESRVPEPTMQEESSARPTKPVRTRTVKRVVQRSEQMSSTDNEPVMATAPAPVKRIVVRRRVVPASQLPVLDSEPLHAAPVDSDQVSSEPRKVVKRVVRVVKPAAKPTPSEPSALASEALSEINTDSIADPHEEVLPEEVVEVEEAQDETALQTKSETEPAAATENISKKVHVAKVTSVVTRKIARKPAPAPAPAPTQTAEIEYKINSVSLSNPPDEQSMRANTDPPLASADNSDGLARETESSPASGEPSPEQCIDGQEEYEYIEQIIDGSEAQEGEEYVIEEYVEEEYEDEEEPGDVVFLQDSLTVEEDENGEDERAEYDDEEIDEENFDEEDIDEEDIVDEDIDEDADEDNYEGEEAEDVAAESDGLNVDEEVDIQPAVVSPPTPDSPSAEPVMETEPRQISPKRANASASKRATRHTRQKPSATKRLASHSSDVPSRIAKEPSSRLSKQPSARIAKEHSRLSREPSARIQTPTEPENVERAPDAASIESKVRRTSRLQRIAASERESEALATASVSETSISHHSEMTRNSSISSDATRMAISTLMTATKPTRMPRHSSMIPSDNPPPAEVSRRTSIDSSVAVASSPERRDAEISVSRKESRAVAYSAAMNSTAVNSAASPKTYQSYDRKPSTSTQIPASQLPKTAAYPTPPQKQTVAAVHEEEELPKESPQIFVDLIPPSADATVEELLLRNYLISTMMPQVGEVATHKALNACTEGIARYGSMFAETLDALWSLLQITKCSLDFNTKARVVFDAIVSTRKADTNAEATAKICAEIVPLAGSLVSQRVTPIWERESKVTDEVIAELVPRIDEYSDATTFKPYAAFFHMFDDDCFDDIEAERRNVTVAHKAATMLLPYHDKAISALSESLVEVLKDWSGTKTVVSLTQAKLLEVTRVMQEEAYAAQEEHCRQVDVLKQKLATASAEIQKYVASLDEQRHIAVELEQMREINHGLEEDLAISRAREEELEELLMNDKVVEHSRLKELEGIAAELALAKTALSSTRDELEVSGEKVTALEERITAMLKKRTELEDVIAEYRKMEKLRLQNQHSVHTQFTPELTEMAIQTDFLTPPMSLQTILVAKNDKIRSRFPQVFPHVDQRYQDLIMERKLPGILERAGIDKHESELPLIDVPETRRVNLTRQLLDVEENEDPQTGSTVLRMNSEMFQDSDIDSHYDAIGDELVNCELPLIKSPDPLPPSPQTKTRPRPSTSQKPPLHVLVRQGNNTRNSRNKQAKVEALELAGSGLASSRPSTASTGLTERPRPRGYTADAALQGRNRAAQGIATSASTSELPIHGAMPIVLNGYTTPLSAQEMWDSDGPPPVTINSMSVAQLKKAFFSRK